LKLLAIPEASSWTPLNRRKVLACEQHRGDYLKFSKEHFTSKMEPELGFEPRIACKQKWGNHRSD